VAAVETKARRERGRRRREHLLRSTLEVIGESGVQRTTHRAVAERARVPVSTTTYYFASLDEMIEAALELFVEDEVERLAAASEQITALSGTPQEAIRAVAAALVALNPPGSAVATAKFELYVAGSRSEALRPMVARAQEAYRRLAATMMEAFAVRDVDRLAPLAVALVDGLGLNALAVPDDRREQRIVEGLEALVLPLIDERA